MTVDDAKRSPESLPGLPEHRVFVGGQYDFMPTIREVARILEEISCPEQTVIPIIPFDYHLRRHEVIPYDLEILRQCRHAIFDLSDLGAQLVEMQETSQNRNRIETLLIYPVRERRNAPQRGRLTILSFGFPHFGYRTFHELKGIIWRFVTKAASDKDLPPRTIHDPILDRELRRVRLLIARDRPAQAERVLKELAEQPRYRETVDLWLQGAVISQAENDESGVDENLAKAARVAKGDDDAAEISFFEGSLAIQNEDWHTALSKLQEADRLRPHEGRTLTTLGYVVDKTGDRQKGMELTRAALNDFYFPDPINAINALNNLAYMHCLAFKESGEKLHLEKALDFSENLHDYHLVFGRKKASWLHTRGVALYLAAKQAHESGLFAEAHEALTQGIRLLEKAVDIREPELYKPDLREALNFEDYLKQSC